MAIQIIGTASSRPAMMNMRVCSIGASSGCRATISFGGVHRGRQDTLAGADEEDRTDGDETEEVGSAPAHDDVEAIAQKVVESLHKPAEHEAQKEDQHGK